MKTFEGIMVVKWYKNDSGGDRRAITIDTENRKTLNAELKRIRVAFLTIPENSEVAYSVKFEEMRERK